jgi:hypothetical protein
MNVEISNCEYLKLLLETDEKHQDLFWCLRTKLQLRKMQSLSGYNLQEQLEKVDLRFLEFGKQVIK